MTEREGKSNCILLPTRAAAANCRYYRSFLASWIKFLTNSRSESCRVHGPASNHLSAQTRHTASSASLPTFSLRSQEPRGVLTDGVAGSGSDAGLEMNDVLEDAFPIAAGHGHRRRGRIAAGLRRVRALESPWSGRVIWYRERKSDRHWRNLCSRPYVSREK